MFVQNFKTTGVPFVNTSNTTTNPPGTKSQTFDSTRPDTDDFLTGETYTPVRVVRGGFLPQLTDPAADPDGALTAKGRFLRFAFSGHDAIYLEPNTTYGVFVSFVSPASQCALTFANLFRGNYAGGHGVRREGKLPSLYAPSLPGDVTDVIFVANQTAAADNGAAMNISAFDPDLAVRAGNMDFRSIEMPDVSTFRDLTFWIEETGDPPPLLVAEANQFAHTDVWIHLFRELSDDPANLLFVHGCVMGIGNKVGDEDASESLGRDDLSQDFSKKTKRFSCCVSY